MRLLNIDVQNTLASSSVINFTSSRAFILEFEDKCQTIYRQRTHFERKIYQLFTKLKLIFKIRKSKNNCKYFPIMVIGLLFLRLGGGPEKNQKIHLFVIVQSNSREKNVVISKQASIINDRSQRCHCCGGEVERCQSLALNWFHSFDIIIQFQMSKAINKLKSKAKEAQSCPVCMTRVVNCQTVECSHQFCYRCLSKWGRRKGNCPLCRTNIRKIQYKKKIIEPKYLKYFDDQSSILATPEVQQEVRPARPPTSQLMPGNYTFFVPLITSYQSFNYYSHFPILMYPHNNT